jgi:virulence-associated protein VapD
LKKVTQPLKKLLSKHGFKIKLGKQSLNERKKKKMGCVPVFLERIFP